MRVVSTMQYRNLVENLEQQRDRNNRAQLQVSSGKRILNLKDDPLAAGEISNLEADSVQSARYLAAGDTALGKLQYTDTVFSHMLNLVTEAVTTAGATISLTNDAAYLEAQAQRVEGIRDELVSSSNSMYQGKYIFSGTATMTTPYPTAASAYQGNGNPIFIRADPETVVQTNIPGDQVFQGTDPQNVFQQLTNLAADIRAHDTNLISQDMADLQGVFDRMNGLETTIGNAVNQLDTIKARLNSAKLQNTTLQGKLGDVNLAEAITDMTLSQSALQATLQSGAKIVQLSLIDYLG